MARIYHNLKITSTPELIFNGVTKPELLNQWWTVKCEGSPIVGSKYQFWFSPEHDWIAVVDSFTPNSRILFRFVQADDDWLETTLEFNIDPFLDHCLLQMRHDLWKEENEHFGRTSFCWALYLNKLKNILEEKKD